MTQQDLYLKSCKKLGEVWLEEGMIELARKHGSIDLILGANNFKSQNLLNHPVYDAFGILD